MNISTNKAHKTEQIDTYSSLLQSNQASKQAINIVLEKQWTFSLGILDSKYPATPFLKKHFVDKALGSNSSTTKKEKKRKGNHIYSISQTCPQAVLHLGLITQE